MTGIDYTIVLLYLGGMVAVGWYFHRAAARGIDAYFLGDRKLPWWVLGASGMASNLDISGTMINTAFIYALGTMGFFVEIRGGIVLIMAFFMIFMGKWNRRAAVMTLAEWMELRFGDTAAGRAARLLAAISVIVSSIAIIAYFAVGAGKFVDTFLTLPPLFGLPPRFWGGAVLIGLAMIYTVASGLYGVVWTDVFQGVLIAASIVIICVIAVTTVELPAEFAISLPTRDGGFLTVLTTREAWTDLVLPWTLDLPAQSTYSIYNLFGLTILFYLIKTVIEGAAGTSGYMAQRFFAARSDREAGLLSLFWIALLSFRWPFVAAIAILGIAIGVQSGVPIADPEAVLPVVIQQILPIGLKGLVVAGLMAAAMSTFDSIVNAAASYWVRDIYQAFLRRDASERQLVRQSRLATVAMVGGGLLLTLDIRSINEVWSWLTMSIGAGLIMPLLVRWYWWRLNGWGFAAGTFAGMAAAILQKLLFDGIADYQVFLSVSAISLGATILVTLLTPATPTPVLTHFYRLTRPFGLWGPVRGALPEAETRGIRTENRRDILAILLAVPWQLVLFLTAMQLVTGRWDLFAILFGILIVLSAGLYVTWFRHLSTEIPPKEEGAG